MGKPTGFLEFGRELPKKLDPSVRIQDNKEFVTFGNFFMFLAGEKGEEEKYRTNPFRALKWGTREEE